MKQKVECAQLEESTKVVMLVGESSTKEMGSYHIVNSIIVHDISDKVGVDKGKSYVPSVGNVFECLDTVGEEIGINKEVRSNKKKKKLISSSPGGRGSGQLIVKPP